MMLALRRIRLLMIRKSKRFRVAHP